MPLRLAGRVIKIAAVSVAITAALLTAAYFYAISPHRPSAPPQSADSILYDADTFAWGNRWEDALPLYRRAHDLFLQHHNLSKALYAEVSEIPSEESASLREHILRLDRDLAKPEARDPETRLRILTIRGMLETNYDASQARSNWQEVESLALKLHHVAEATRSQGEQGIAAFILGDTDRAKKLVVRAWVLSKVEHDPAATVRYASVFGEGLVGLHRYKEALGPLNDAIKLATSDQRVGYPTIAVYAKIEALDGLHRYDEALQLANQSLARLQGTAYDGRKSQVYIDRGSVYKDLGNWNSAIEDFTHSVQLSSHIDNYRGVADAGGPLADAYFHLGKLPEALAAINTAIDANTKIPEELYLAPQNLAIKARITAAMGQSQASEVLYQKSITLVEGMLQHVPTVEIQRHLLAEMSDVYSGYFGELCRQHRFEDALHILEQVRGRIETEALEHHSTQPVHPPTRADQELTRLNIALINTGDPGTRARLTAAIYNAELNISPSALAQMSIAHPVRLRELEASIPENTVLVEYVLAEPDSYALAVTHSRVAAYKLASRQQIETEADKYRSELQKKQQDLALGKKLFTDIIAPVEAYRDNMNLVIIPDGSLHLLPFSALLDRNGYLLKTHSIDVAPSATVYSLLRKRATAATTDSLPYVGVAAWTRKAENRNPIVRAVMGPSRDEFEPLPDSQLEVETIAEDLPKPSTLLLGSDATETRFKHLDLNKVEVLHLALHGYADIDYPERSALIFAPDPSGTNDGLLQVREVRALHLNAKLVTLSACNTGVGPVGAAGVSNLVNAFIEAGADSVVSTLWEMEDHPTEYLMSEFYGKLAQRARKGDALRAAQLSLVDRGLPPYYWAGVQIVGDAENTL